jgi:hypothetical protein
MVELLAATAMMMMMMMMRSGEVQVHDPERRQYLLATSLWAMTQIVVAGRREGWQCQAADQASDGREIHRPAPGMTEANLSQRSLISLPRAGAVRAHPGRTFLVTALYADRAWQAGQRPGDRRGWRGGR